MASPPIKFIHQNDIKWIIQLWLAKHGGDPAPDAEIPAREISQAASTIIQKLTAHLDPAKAKAVNAALGH